MQSCWHTRNAVDHILSAYKQHLSNLFVTPHIQALNKIIYQATARYGHGLKVLDVGCGTALVARLFSEHSYTGADLPHMIDECATRLNPEYQYRYIDWENTPDYKFLQEYNLIVANAFIDVLELPIEQMARLLSSKKPIILHRQEISNTQHTHCIQNPSYGSLTWHSIINREEFMELLRQFNYGIIAQEQCGFDNWENQGHSMLLEPNPSWALHGADHKLVELFKGKQNGIYIEAGANDGIRQSNTMLLHSHYGWKGILIEPVPEVFEKLKINRPEDDCVHAALVEENYGHEKCVIEYTPECYGLMSALKGMPFTKERMQKAGEPGVGVWAPALTLNQIIKATLMPGAEIDLLVLDIEGYELKALQGIDLDKWEIQALMIEELDHSSTAIADYLKPWYRRAHRFGENDIIYLRK